MGFSSGGAEGGATFVTDRKVKHSNVYLLIDDVCNDADDRFI